MILIEVDVFFNSKETEELRQIGISDLSEYDEVCKMVFNLDEFSSANESSNPSRTTLRLKNGNSFNINVPYIDFISSLKAIAEHIQPKDK